MFLFLAACWSPEEPASSELVVPLTDGEDPYTDTAEPVDDTDAPDTADTGGSVIPEDEAPPALVLNEVMTKNGYSLKVDGEYPDWVELFNASPETVDLSRVTLTDGSGRVWLGPAGTEILPGGYQLVYADGIGAGLHAPFTLDSDGDTVSLAVDGWVVDRLATGQLDADIAWARFPDGGAWAPTIWITAGETNGSVASDTLDTDSTLFGLYTVHQIQLQLSSSAVNSLGSSPTIYVQGEITMDGSDLDPIGVRLRGSSTLRTINEKCSFKIDTNRYDDLRFRGRKKFNLINMVWDASHVREYVSYYMFREFGVPAAQNAYAWVEMNGSDKGLYLLSEAYDDDFLESWYGNSDGYMWEPGSGDFSSAGAGWDCEEGSPCDTSVISPIRSLLAGSATDSAVADLENYLDLDNVLREIAVEIAVGQWDGYCSPHNYRVYWDPQTGLATILPSSVDLTFDNLGYTYGHDYFSCGGAVLGWCLSNSGCEDRYLDILDELADGIEGGNEATDLHLMDLLDEIDALITDYQADDTSTGLSGFTEAQTQQQFDYVRTYLQDEPSRIREQADARR
jgi:hypothetical protein